MSRASIIKRMNRVGAKLTNYEVTTTRVTVPGDYVCLFRVDKGSTVDWTSKFVAMAHDRPVMGHKATTKTGVGQYITDITNPGSYTLSGYLVASQRVANCRIDAAIPGGYAVVATKHMGTNTRLYLHHGDAWWSQQQTPCTLTSVASIDDLIVSYASMDVLSMLEPERVSQRSWYLRLRRIAGTEVIYHEGSNYYALWVAFYVDRRIESRRQRRNACRAH